MNDKPKKKFTNSILEQKKKERNRNPEKKYMTTDFHERRKKKAILKAKQAMTSDEAYTGEKKRRLGKPGKPAARAKKKNKGGLMVAPKRAKRGY